MTLVKKQLGNKLGKKPVLQANQDTTLRNSAIAPPFRLIETKL